MSWRRRGAWGVVAVWVVVAVARASRLVEPAAVAPGQELVALLPALRADIPSSAGYLYVLPGEFGSDTGTGPRLRYELYPRRYDDVRASADEASVRDLMRREDLTFIVVPDLDAYPASHWLRQPGDWFHAMPLGDDSAVLVASP